MTVSSHEPHGAINGSSEDRKIVGNLACQHDTYLTHLHTQVCECEKNITKKCPKDEAFEVQLLDTILFPEGGGQPWDLGTLAFQTEEGEAKELQVRKVLRRKLQAIHYTSSPIEVGTKVRVELDFARRFDQAQQHSGQHLLSAVLDQLDIPTLAWSMGPEIVYVEVPRLPEDFKAVENTCNQYIRENLPITVTETRERPKNLPQDYDASAGVIRVVSIGGIDANPCCGTHVRSTAELNSLTILYSTAVKGANRNNFRIHFLVGGRCQKALSRLHEKNRAMGASLSCQADDLPEKVTVLQDQLKDLFKREKTMKAELVDIAAGKLRQELQGQGKAFLHRPTGDVEFLNAVLAALGPDVGRGTSLLVSGESQGGSVIISGPESEVKRLSERVKQEMPHLKGGGKPSKFQGKTPMFAKGNLAFLQSLVA